MTVHSFQPPRLTVKLSLGHKHRGWYLIFAYPYRTLDSREIARLDTSGPLKTRGVWSTRPRFWFDPHACSGWEADGETLLDLLLSPAILEPLFAVVDHEAGYSKVEVLVPEHKLAHFCEGCERWEAAGDAALRWFMVRSSPLPSYLCPACHSHDWFGARLQRSLKRTLSICC
ncbi:hypothetical protein MSAN_02097600 [Mycena sanguinolenta]|uniref:Uncharacterized protein n=1 Tax=Mycena sanguinolenta TaxID=230812 RepID=A0A8H6XHC1_9AGAR|nr:hypothetical protein MSAN_02097600 [Mycena sanguinolenta]